MQTILETLVEVDTPPERLQELFALGLKRLEQQQALFTIPNPTGYLIGILRNVAGEALVRGWDVAQMRAEGEEKHAQALRSRGYAEPEAQAPTAAATAEASAEAPGATSATTEAARGEERSTPEATLVPESADAEEPAQDGPYEAAQREAREEAERYASRPIDPQARQIWQSVLGRIQPKVSSSAFTTWFGGTKGLVFEDEKLVVQVGSSFSREHLENRFQDLIWSAVSEQRGIETKTRYIVLPDAQEDD